MSSRLTRICRSEQELAINIKKATNPDETAPKRKHVRSCIVYTWDHKSGQSFWAGLKVCVYLQRVLFHFQDDGTYHHRTFKEPLPTESAEIQIRRTRVKRSAHSTGEIPAIHDILAELGALVTNNETTFKRRPIFQVEVSSRGKSRRIHQRRR